MNVLLDLDGTLTDPREGITRCIQYALERMGRDVPDADDLVRYIGPPLHESFREILAGGDAEVRQAVALYRERFGETGLYENTLYPGIEAALARLLDCGAKLAVATSKPAVYARRIVSHFGLDARLETIWGSELDGTRTDKADLLAHIIDEAGIDPATTVMVGDRRHDVLGAIRNRIRPVGVAWGYGSRAELTEAGAECILDHPEELAGLSARADSQAMMARLRRRPPL